MTTDRAFACFSRGELRDLCLAQFRVGLRKLRNPETGATFTADEVARATGRGGRWWIEADGLDLVQMAVQSRAIWLAQQLRPERASDSFLFGYHGEMWGQTRLAAVGGSGLVEAHATPGTEFLGSTTVPDSGVTTARDDASGLRFQVLTSITVDSSRVAQVSMIGIDTGLATNIIAGSVLRWENPPIGADPEAVVIAKFEGGRAEETSSEFAARMKADIRHKPASGNRAHFRSWAREDVRVADAYVYACAFHAGSVLLSITQRRGDRAGPYAMMADANLLATTRAYLVPPGSTVVPERPFVVVTSFTPEPTYLTLRVGMARGSKSGWTDAVPWPVYGDGSDPIATVHTFTDATHFSMDASTNPPNDHPHLMAWDSGVSRWVELDVQTVTLVSGTLYNVVLSSAPTMSAGRIWAGDPVCADTGLRKELSEAVEEYFDSLGPGEVVDLYGDTRSDRAARFPEQEEEASATAGTAIVSKIIDTLGAQISNVDPHYSILTPALPSSISLGPRKLTLAGFRIFPF